MTGSFKCLVFDSKQVDKANAKCNGSRQYFRELYNKNNDNLTTTQFTHSHMWNMLNTTTFITVVETSLSR